ncbi:MAG: response regulator transcription factor [Synergistaceae bacterium]|jgi:DNA-binding response OmpR family regulator|nr:response regulator transcription factor [Synergistaceae bacterium]
MNEKILIAEDDPAILAGVSDILKLEGYDVLEAPNGAAAIELYRSSRPDLLLLDVMMPIMSGYDVCRAIRREDEATPILMLTAKGEEIDKVVGLELGADDYIVKPFGIAELTARVRSALRRAALGKKTPAGGSSASEAILRLGDVTVDFDAMTAMKSPGGHIPLTPKETELLKYLTSHPGKVISRETLLEAVWGIAPDSDITTRSVDTHVARLRQKIEGNPAEPRFIQTVHGAGYRFIAE